MATVTDIGDFKPDLTVDFDNPGIAGMFTACIFS
jgi:hypothetical protein